MIIDNFLFCNEYDVLEIRLNTMYDHVDRFVIVESDYTFTGIFKGYNFEKEIPRYSQFMDKIHYIKISKSPYTDPWLSEDWMRDHYKLGWQDIRSTDVLLISDCDEIIRPEALEFVKHSDFEWYGFYAPAFYFKINYLDTKPNWHYKVWARAFRNTNINPGKLKYQNPQDLPGKKSIALHHAGWHFGWLGDNEFVKNKLKSFSHSEYNTKEILDNIDIKKHITEGRDHIRPENITWTPVKLDNYFPKYILENKNKFTDYILPDNDRTVRDYWTNNILEKELL